MSGLKLGRMNLSLLVVNYPPAGEKEARQSLKYAESLIGFVKKKIKYFNN
ncbi:hypothetical protein KKA66_00420 [Patescibacteria group bacterium]|nr:hypothetical protein [Patescibacteria group bacterium]